MLKDVFSSLGCTIPELVVDIVVQVLIRAKPEPLATTRFSHLRYEIHTCDGSLGRIPETLPVELDDVARL